MTSEARCAGPLLRSRWRRPGGPRPRRRVPWRVPARAPVQRLWLVLGTLLATVLAPWPLAGCTPALNWRDVRPPHSAVGLQLPCRSTAQERAVALAGVPVRLTLHACAAADMTWALAFADVPEPAQVGPALLALRQAAAANIGASQADELPLQVRGATPNPRSGRWRLAGRLPDGAPVQMQLAVFAHGTQVFQASVLGAQLADDAVDSFFSAIRIGR